MGISIGSLCAKLKTDINTSNDPWEKVDLINEFLEKARDWSPRISLEWIEKGLEWASSVGYERAIFFLLIHKAYVHLIQGDVKASEYSLEQSRSLFAGEELWPKEAAYFYHSRAVLEINIGLPTAAGLSFKKAAELAEKANCVQLLANALNNIGLLQMDDEDFSKAEKTFQKALKTGSSHDYPIEFTKIYNNLGLMYRIMGEYEKALYYLDLGMKNGEETENGPHLASISQETALIFEGWGNRASAAHWFKKSLAYIEEMDYLAKHVLSDYGRFLLKDPESVKEGLAILSEMIEPLKAQGDNPNLLQVYEILLAYYEMEKMDKESLTIYRKLMELEKEQNRQQYTADVRKIKREMILEQQAHMSKLIEAGNKILRPMNKKGVFEAFRKSMVFIDSCETAILAEQKSGKKYIKVRYYYSNGEYLKAKDPISVDSSESFIAYSIRKKREIVVQDLDNEARFILKNVGFIDDKKIPYTIKSLACLPFLRKGKKCVISIQNSEKDYFTKERLDYLRRLLTFLAAGLDTAEKNKEIARLSTRDSLTNLYNRRQFFKQAELSWASHSRSGSPLGVAILDLDHFKIINDRHGHGAGDRCLLAFSALLKKILRRKTDIYARYGGEEFIIMMGYSELDIVREIAEVIRKGTEDLRIEEGEKILKMTVSIGLSHINKTSSKNMETVIEEADRALYKAKSYGRNRVVDINSMPGLIINPDISHHP